jgi:hypothetical protein
VSQAQFIQARELIKEKRYDEARAILRGIDHPRAREWLAKLDQLTPPPRSELFSIQEQMAVARDLIREERYDEARGLLQGIDHPKAREWLAKLDQIAPPAAETGAPALQEQLSAARDLLVAKRYDEARSALANIDHPTAKQWLAKLDSAAPVTAPPESESAAPAAVSAPAHDDIVREAQHLLLKGDYDRARVMLEPLHTPVAAFWIDKTAVNQFRSHENLWLDMFRYAVPSEPPVDPVAWRCPICLRKLGETSLCPQRGEKPCPAQVVERPIEEPRRLALILEALQHDQAQSINKLVGSIGVARLEQWQAVLVWQLDHLLEPDIRRPAIEAAITLLGQLADQRRS